MDWEYLLIEIRKIREGFQEDQRRWRADAEKKEREREERRGREREEKLAESRRQIEEQDEGNKKEDEGLKGENEEAISIINNVQDSMEEKRKSKKKRSRRADKKYAKVPTEIVWKPDRKHQNHRENERSGCLRKSRKKGKHRQKRKRRKKNPPENSYLERRRRERWLFGEKQIGMELKKRKSLAISRSRTQGHVQRINRKRIKLKKKARSRSKINDEKGIVARSDKREKHISGQLEMINIESQGCRRGPRTKTKGPMTAKLSKNERAEVAADQVWVSGHRGFAISHWAQGTEGFTDLYFQEGRRSWSEHNSDMGLQFRCHYSRRRRRRRIGWLEKKGRGGRGDRQWPFSKTKKSKKQRVMSWLAISSPEKYDGGRMINGSKKFSTSRRSEERGGWLLRKAQRRERGNVREEATKNLGGPTQNPRHVGNPIKMEKLLWKEESRRNNEGEWINELNSNNDGEAQVKNATDGNWAGFAHALYWAGSCWEGDEAHSFLEAEFFRVVGSKLGLFYEHLKSWPNINIFDLGKKKKPAARKFQSHFESAPAIIKLQPIVYHPSLTATAFHHRRNFRRNPSSSLPVLEAQINKLFRGKRLSKA